MAFKTKTLLFVCLLGVAILAVPKAEAITVPIGGFLNPIGGVLNPIGDILGRLLNGSLADVRGTVYCTLDGNPGPAGSAAPPFANATVLLQCGSANISVALGRTDVNGQFRIILAPANIINTLLPLSTSLLRDCNLVVITPLASCNATLPRTGILTSNLVPAGQTFLPQLNIQLLVNGLFRLVNATVTVQS